ncbi:hypothetical protein [Reinekea marinisedimentorum]|uniref:HMA domain-containing protein n=1 Tax=Reinekea marinisedimentorum TaxID=230495 RepID=A0A4R3HWX1_9GAMM|nr:hypothetical protein [Reinekea marinisedimentorum]TCS36761.1 hypothetical protein BCF53_12235 [Reinekea marinisedimentorum]
MNRASNATIPGRTWVKRTFYLNRSSLNDMNHVTQTLDSALGIHSVTFMPIQNSIEVVFDARLTCSQQIVAIFQQHHLPLRAGLKDRVRFAWYRFIEQNIKDNESSSRWKPLTPAR